MESITKEKLDKMSYVGNVFVASSEKNFLEWTILPRNKLLAFQYMSLYTIFEKSVE